MFPDFSYAKLFLELRAHLLRRSPSGTAEVTKEIKTYFRERFSASYTVLCSDDLSKEYLVDVAVSSFDPRSIIKQRTLQIVPSTVSVLLAVESELGGEGASSAYGVMKNVAADYLKLLVTRCERRAMVFTSLPYAGERDHVFRRVQILRELYQRTPGLKSGALLVHLDGSQPVSSQVRAKVDPDSIRGFEISDDGSHVVELPFKFREIAI